MSEPKIHRVRAFIKFRLYLVFDRQISSRPVSQYHYTHEAFALTMNVKWAIGTLFF